MKFNELDAKMRIYETNTDQHVLPGMHIIVRLDGRGFTRLTKELLFDLRFHSSMKKTVKHVMSCGIKILTAIPKAMRFPCCSTRRKHRSTQAAEQIGGMDVSDKNELLYSMGVNYNGSSCVAEARDRILLQGCPSQGNEP
jgi:tRNA(His) 5'-end guanylyltransferase